MSNITGDMVILEKWVTVDGLRIHYLATGSGGTVPLLLIHGGGSDYCRFSWKHALSDLAPAHPVIAVDLPGYGESELSAPLLQDPFRYHIDFIPRFLSALGIDQVNLMGVSMGGGISLGVTLNRPDLINRLILVAPYGLGNKIRGGGLTYLAAQLPLVSTVIRKALFASPGLVRLGLQQLTAPSYRVSGEMVKEAWTTLLNHGMHLAWKEFQLTELTRRGPRSYFVPRLGEIVQPTLILHGRNDRLLSCKFSETAAEYLPNGNCRIFEACGHLLPREKPAEFARAVLSFLS